MDKGEGAHLVDKEGRRYLDMEAGITRPVHVGCGRHQKAGYIRCSGRMHQLAKYVIIGHGRLALLAVPGDDKRCALSGTRATSSPPMESVLAGFLAATLNRAGADSIAYCNY